MATDPAEIVDGLYLGSKLSAAKRELLAKHHITHIVNTAQEIPSYFESDPTLAYLELHLEDSERDYVYSQFRPTAAWIESALADKGRVFVHCQAGISRSSTIVIAYLMLHHNLTLRNAFFHTRDKKHNIQPNVYFFKALQQLDRELGTPEEDIFSLQDYYVDVLVSMGFDRAKAERELKLADGDFDIALGGCLM